MSEPDAGMVGTGAGGQRVGDYDYELPDELVARYPATERDESRLLVLPKSGAPLWHTTFARITDLVRPGDLFVLNESRVRPLRLMGRKPTGAPAEVLLIRPAGDDRRWEALVRPGSKLKPGRTVEIADDFVIHIEDSVPGGGRIVRLETPLGTDDALERHGHVPLPPYLGRDDEPLDRERYQTVYARVPGSVAAPTAGFHFTNALLDEIRKAGAEIERLVLHVGVGTFRPVEVDDPARHVMHREYYEVSEAVAHAVARAREDGGRVWAVGTTVVRVLESVAGPDGAIRPGAGWTDLFIRPPRSIESIDCLVTNFHLPRSTLLMLVSALAGYERTMSAYAEAVAERYRFYSYGDAMVVL